MVQFWCRDGAIPAQERRTRGAILVQKWCNFGARAVQFWCKNSAKMVQRPAACVAQMWRRGGAAEVVVKTWSSGLRVARERPLDEQHCRQERPSPSCSVTTPRTCPVQFRTTCRAAPRCCHQGLSPHPAHLPPPLPPTPKVRCQLRFPGLLPPRRKTRQRHFAVRKHSALDPDWDNFTAKLVGELSQQAKLAQ